ncbi:MAG: Flp pilus assembly protein CpaB [Deltaproteobacteria bacterium]|nr:Flp pilus assembly protein CpaB [Deltaproteobacteria bacterium]
MNRKAMIISIAFALTAVLLAQLYLRRLEREISGGPAVAVLAAARDILPGTAVERSMLATRDLPQAYLEQRHVRASDLHMVLGAVVSTEIKADESLLWTDLSAAQRGRRGLSGLVREGMRAIAIEARGSSFGGLVRPGDRVDLLFTSRAQLDSVKTQSTSTLLQNLLVLAVGSDLGEGENTGETDSGQVTLSVTVEQAQVLTLAEHHGALKLVLRNPNDIVLLKELPQASLTRAAGEAQSFSWQDLGSGKERAKEIEHVR